MSRFIPRNRIFKNKKRHHWPGGGYHFFHLYFFPLFSSAPSGNTRFKPPLIRSRDFRAQPLRPTDPSRVGLLREPRCTCARVVRLCFPFAARTIYYLCARNNISCIIALGVRSVANGGHVSIARAKRPNIVFVTVTANRVWELLSLPAITWTISHAKRPFCDQFALSQTAKLRGFWLSFWYNWYCVWRNFKMALKLFVDFPKVCCCNIWL